MNYYDILTICLGTAVCIFLFFFAGYAADNLNPKFRLMYFLPAVIAVGITLFSGAEKAMIPVYAGAAFCAFGFFREKAAFRRIVSLISAVSILSAVPVCLNYKGYRSPDYNKEFEKVFSTFKQRYVLSDWKGIDYDALYAKYKPVFEKAQKEHDESANYSAMLCFLSEFHDGHVGYGYMSEYMLQEQELVNKLFGDDHGLVLMNLDDGRTVAVQVDKKLSEKGIHNGTVITEWNGRPIDEAAAEVPVDINLSNGSVMFTADKDNRYFYRSTLLAGTGGSSPEVTFIDDDGNEKTAVLESMGDYLPRLKAAMSRLDDGIKCANFGWTTADGKIPVLRIKSMFFDAKSSAEEMKEPEKSYADMKEDIRSHVTEAMENGQKDLIIDLRYNGGGSGNLIRAIAEVLGTKGEHLYNYNGVWDNKTNRYKTDEEGHFLLGKKNMLESEGLLDSGKIVILVNAGSISAADHLVHVMGQMENVTVMGFTKTNGSAQGVTIKTLDKAVVSMSGSMMLNEDGTPFVDSGKDGLSGNTLDVKLPFDDEALDAIFNKDEDYLLSKAVEYLTK